MKIVTVACDCYADIAASYEYLLDKNWRNHPEVVYVTNSRKLKVNSQVHYIKGEDAQFGWRFRRFVRDHYKDELLVFMMIDYLVKGVHLRLIDRAVALCERDDIGHVRLRPMPHPQLPFEDSRDFGEIKHNTPYALSLQPGIWETKLLHDLCRDDEDPWQTEVQGSRRMQNVKKRLLSTKVAPIVVHHNYYRRGKALGLNWVRDNVPSQLWPDAVRKEYGK